MADLTYISKTVAPAGRNKYGNYVSSTNITRSVINTTYGGNGSTTTIAENTSEGGGSSQENVSFYCMLVQPNMTFTEHDLDNNVSASTQIVAYKNFAAASTYICDLNAVTAVTSDGIVQSLTAPDDGGIVKPNGVTVWRKDNGTSASTFEFSVNSNFTGDTGIVNIPVAIYKRDEAIPEPDDLYDWWDSKDDCEQIWLEFAINVNRASGSSGGTGPAGESAYYLTLSNDNATVNVDASGNVITSSLPACQGRLYHGTQKVTSGITYNMNYGSATGVSSAVSSGVFNLMLGPDFNFTGNSMSITISAVTDNTDNTLRDVKTMNITKSFPGPNGEPAVRYWIEPSYGSVIYDPNTKTPNPPAITVKGYRQIGGGNREDVTSVTFGTTFKYSLHYRNVDSFTPNSAYNSSIQISSAMCENYDKIRIKMLSGSSEVDMEDVDILADGLNGTNGQGRQGAAIRGPYDYAEVSASTRCWCSGEEGEGGCEECEKWIDVIVKDGVYYYCNTTYYGKLTPWTGANGVQSAWTSGDSFNFVATNILLASAAGINFLTNNWLYLKDESGNTVGGARGTSVDSGVTFWSGAEDPENAKFKVDYQGNIYAMNGVFGGYIRMPYTDISELTTGGTSQYVRYNLDKRAYVIGYHGNNNYNTLVLPTPSAEWDGFMYYLLIKGYLNTHYGTREDVSCFVEVSGGGATILDYVYKPVGLRGFSRAGLYGGKYQFVCADLGEGYRWLMTEATGGANLYGTTHDCQEGDWRCFRPVFGYEDVEGTPQIKNIMISPNTNCTGGTYYDDNTMYVQ